MEFSIGFVSTPAGLVLMDGPDLKESSRAETASWHSWLKSLNPTLL